VGRARGLIRGPNTQVLTVYHDDPEVTPEDKLRVDACITVPKDAPVDGEIGKMTVPGGKFAIAHFEISGDEYGEAWNALMEDGSLRAGTSLTTVSAMSCI